MYDLAAVRKQFPTLHQSVHDRPLVYLDNAATTQKPQAVIDVLSHYYEHDNANIHRGVHELSQRATVLYEKARDTLRDFIGAAESRELIFVRGTTEGVNLVAQSFVRPKVGKGDEIIVTELEHHSNIVPWQMVCEQTGATLKVVPVNDAGELDMTAYQELLSSNTRFVSVGHVSNALGTINPVKEMTRLAHAAGAHILIDGAQAAPHLAIDVQDLDCDFYAFSGHKMYGPTGIGVLYGKAALLEAMPPYQGGGEMISSVTFTGTTYNEIPHKFEAGTPDISGAIGMGAAATYLTDLGLDAIAAHEHTLLEAATKGMEQIPGARILGTAANKSAVLSFTLTDIHPHDVGSLLDADGVAIRTGHHCAQPIMDRFQVPATSRASFGLYNTMEEVETFLASVRRVVDIFGGA